VQAYTAMGSRYTRYFTGVMRVVGVGVDGVYTCSVHVRAGACRHTCSVHGMVYVHMRTHVCVHLYMHRCSYMHA